MQEKGKRPAVLSRIANRGDALAVVRATAIAFFVIAILQIIASFWVGREMLADASIYVIGGFFLVRFNSRLAALMLLTLAGLTALITIANLLGPGPGGGTNVALALIILLVAVRAVEATFKLHKLFAVPPSAGGQEAQSGPPD